MLRKYQTFQYIMRIGNIQNTLYVSRKYFNKKSIAGFQDDTNEYRDYFIWHDGKDNGGARPDPPNNWVCIYRVHLFILLMQTRSCVRLPFSLVVCVGGCVRAK